MSNTSVIHDAPSRTTTVGFSAAAVGALVALLAVWAMGGSAQAGGPGIIDVAGTDDLVGVEADITLGLHGESPDTHLVCYWPSESDDDPPEGTSTGLRATIGITSGGSGSGSTSDGSSGNGDGNGSSGNGSGNGDGNGSGNGSGGSGTLIDIDVLADVSDLTKVKSGSTVLDATVDGTVANPKTSRGLLSGLLGVSVDGSTHGKGATVDVDASADVNASK